MYKKPRNNAGNKGQGMQYYKASISGTEPIIHHSGVGVDPRLPANIKIAEILNIKPANRTKAHDKKLIELEIDKSIWWEHAKDGTPIRPTVPEPAIRAVIEAAARKTKEGGLVREGLIVESTTFTYDEAKYGKGTKLKYAELEFRVPVMVQRSSRIMRTRAMFDLPWSVEFVVEVDPDLVDTHKLRNWLSLGGRRLGLGDWRPEKSGRYGRFELSYIKEHNE